jgi:ferric-dicitrate binding protein FerR (iron transport regulator)
MNREELFDKHLRGELSAGETADLKRLLAHDADAGRAFVEYTNETALLVRVGSQIQSGRLADNVVLLPSLEERVVRAPGGEKGTRGTRPSRILKWVAVAACFLALAVLFAFLNRDSRPRHIAEVYVTGEGVQVTRGNAALAGENIELLAGDIISTPTNSTAVVVYEFESTRIELQPGSVLVFGDATQGKRFELRRGTIQAHVAPQPADLPMSVETAHALATVLGTEFVMRADESATKLDVLEGKVQLACRVTGKTAKVKAGFAATLNPKSPFSIAPLCKTNCILRECRDTNALSKSRNSKQSNEK